MKSLVYLVASLMVGLAACQPTTLVTPTVVAPTQQVTVQPALTPSAQAQTSAEVLQFLERAIQQQDAAAIVSLVDMDYLFGYAAYIEGGQSVTLEEFRTDLEARLPSAPSCLGYHEEQDTLQVWYSGWAPAWEMTEHCYAECQPLDETWLSSSAGFLLDNEEGVWILKALYLNEPAAYYYRELELSACS